MTTLLVENFKPLVLALWIGSTIVLAKLGDATKGARRRRLLPTSHP